MKKLTQDNTASGQKGRDSNTGQAAAQARAFFFVSICTPRMGEEPPEGSERTLHNAVHLQTVRGLLSSSLAGSRFKRKRKNLLALSLQLLVLAEIHSSC